MLFAASARLDESRHPKLAIDDGIAVAHRDLASWARN
jgi:hypothetical protein